MPNFLVFLLTSSEAIVMSYLYGYGREITDGGTTNRVFTFFIQFLFLSTIHTHLIKLLSGFSLGSGFNVFYYGSIVTLAGINYLATICHSNQIARNAENENKIRKLPFNLHNSSLFSKIFLFLSPNINYVLYASYALTLIFNLAFGAYLSAGTTLLMLMLDQLYQRGWFPKFLEQPYHLLRESLLSMGVTIQVCQIFGLRLEYTIGISIFCACFCLVDYIITHLRGAQSASCQFVASKPAHEFSFDKASENIKPKNQNELSELLDTIKGRKIRVTFDHFRGAAVVTDKILASVPDLPFEEYSERFNKLDFTNESFREIILNEMAVHDKFNECPLTEQRIKLNLAETASLTDVHISFLKREMTELVEKLQCTSARSLTHEHRNRLTREARILLNHLRKNDENRELQERILLALATRTGSHCIRVYLDTFVELCQQHLVGHEQVALTIKERGMLLAQQLREERFKFYYYTVKSTIDEFLAYSLDFNYFLLSDTNDYHAYENFTLTYGRFFYFENLTLNQQFRGLSDIAVDWYQYYSLKRIGIDMLFSSYYNAKFFIKEVINGKLSPLFKEWCESLYPEAYEDFVLDEDSCVDERSPQVTHLARLMLLDCGIVEFEEPYLHTSSAKPAVTSYDSLMRFLFKAPSEKQEQPIAPPHPSTKMFIAQHRSDLSAPVLTNTLCQDRNTDLFFNRRHSTL